MKLIFNRSLYWSIAIFFLINISISGQTGKISGRVVESSTGEPLPFVNVLIMGTTQGAATDMDGYYAILNVRPGTYSIRASAIGFHSVTTENVKVSIDLTTQINFELIEESIELGEEVVVVAEKPMVTKDLTASTALVSSDEIAALPVTEFQEVLQLQAGVVGGTVRGGRHGEVTYAIDGVPVTDAYDKSTVVDVNTSAIQELQFISGAFNAEYGKAMSAYVNLATKEGESKFTGSVTAYLGDYYSARTNIYRGADQFNPVSIRNLEGNLSGPIVPGTLSFYANARYIYFGGAYEGKRVFNPWDITTNLGPDLPPESRYDIQQTGDGELVPMDWNEKIYLHGKLTYQPFIGGKINYTYITDRVRYQNYDHFFAYNPDGIPKQFRTGITNILSLTHAPSASTFYQTSFSYFFKEYRSYVYEDYRDPKYTHSRLLSQQPQNGFSFSTGGTNNNHYKRTTNSYGIKVDLTSQITRIHQVKAGVDFNVNQITFDNITLLQYIDSNGNGMFDPGEDGIEDPQVTGNPFVNMRVPDVNNPNENLSIDRFHAKPIEFSAYLQDKIELESMIINFGLRFDYFQPDGKELTDPSDPDIYRPRRPENASKSLDERRSYWYKDADAKYQISPRLGVAFPITDRGVIHFSFGHFFQVPNYQYLYTNPEYKFGLGTGNLGIAGNPNLKPEQTVSGEIGVQQAITDMLTIDVTGYFRDIKNLTGTRADFISMFGGSGSYSQYVNSDFGFVRGIVFTLTKRFSDNWSATLDYTLQTAKGNASDPAATRNQLVSGNEPEVQLVRLDWDQTHTINLTFNYSMSNWGLSFIGNYGSGFPYTPTQSLNVSRLLTNSELKPSTINLDMRAYYDILIGNYKISVFARVYNLLDIRNQVGVYSDSGTADFTIDEYLRRREGAPEVVNSLDEYYRNPSMYSSPRRIEFGTTLFF